MTRPFTPVNRWMQEIAATELDFFCKHIVIGRWMTVSQNNSSKLVQYARQFHWRKVDKAE